MLKKLTYRLIKYKSNDRVINIIEINEIFTITKTHFIKTNIYR